QRMRGSPRPGPVGGVDRSTPERAGRRRLRAVRLSTFERAVFGTSSLSKYTRSVLTPAATGKERTMKWAALIAWVLTAGGGFVLLSIWLMRGGIGDIGEVGQVNRTA